MLTTSQRWPIILILGLLQALTPFTIDLYLPAFPSIAADLNTAVARVSLSVAIYFVGFALGQIIYGPLLDRFGRKPPLLAGLVVYAVATLGCMTARTVEALLVFRFITALGGSAASVASMAMVRDYFPVKENAKIFSLLMLVLSTSPFFAPSIGSLIITHYSWRYLFAFLLVMVAMDMLLVAFVLPPGYQANAKVSLRLKPMLRDFREIFANPDFRIYTLSGSFAFAGLFVYVAGSPAIFMEEYAVSPQLYGAIFAFIATGLIGGGQLNHLLLKRYTSHQVYFGSLVVEAAGSIVLTVLLLTMKLSLWPTVGLLFVALSGAGVSNPNSTALSLEPFSENIGRASALMGFLRLGIGAAVAAVVGVVNLKGALPTAATIAASSVVGLLLLLRRPATVSKRP